MPPEAGATHPAARFDRRAQRRQQTIAEILDLAQDVMATDGVTGLTISAVARRLGVQPPSIYKYFPSLMSVYDALFRRGQEEHLDAIRAAMSGPEPGLRSLAAGLEASGRWVVANPVLGQLLFWRPVPNFVPTPDAFAPSIAMVELFGAALSDAVAAGKLGPEATTDDAMALLSVLAAGVMSQHMANEPETAFDEGRFTPLLPRVLDLFRLAYPPA